MSDVLPIGSKKAERVFGSKLRTHLFLVLSRAGCAPNAGSSSRRRFLRVKSRQLCGGSFPFGGLRFE
jgi:hypothetical protein